MKVQLLSVQLLFLCQFIVCISPFFLFLLTHASSCDRFQPRGYYCLLSNVYLLRRLNVIYTSFKCVLRTGGEILNPADTRTDIHLFMWAYVYVWTYVLLRLLLLRYCTVYLYCENLKYYLQYTLPICTIQSVKNKTCHYL